MKIENLFMITLILVFLVGGAYLVYVFASADDTLICERPYVKDSGKCCLDADFNNVCDSKQLVQTQSLAPQLETISYAQRSNTQTQEIVKLESEVNYYKNLYQSTLRERDYYYNRYWDDDDDDDEDEYELTVIVRDADTNERLEDARVRVEDGDVDVEYTDDDGEAEFDVEEDCYDIEVELDGYDEEDKRRCIDDDETVSFYLEKI